MSSREKHLLTCHAERQRSIYSHQPGGVAHVDASLPLSMTRRGHFLIASREKHKTSQGWRPEGSCAALWKRPARGSFQKLLVLQVVRLKLVFFLQILVIIIIIIVVLVQVTNFI